MRSYIRQITTPSIFTLFVLAASLFPQAGQSMKGASLVREVPEVVYGFRAYATKGASRKGFSPEELVQERLDALRLDKTPQGRYIVNADEKMAAIRLFLRAVWRKDPLMAQGVKSALEANALFVVNVRPDISQIRPLAARSVLARYNVHENFLPLIGAKVHAPDELKRRSYVMAALKAGDVHSLSVRMAPNHGDFQFMQALYGAPNLSQLRIEFFSNSAPQATALEEQADSLRLLASILENDKGNLTIGARHVFRGKTSLGVGWIAGATNIDQIPATRAIYTGLNNLPPMMGISLKWGHLENNSQTMGSGAVKK